MHRLIDLNVVIVVIGGEVAESIIQVIQVEKDTSVYIYSHSDNAVHTFIEAVQLS